MRQRLEIIVMASVNPDHWIPNERKNERALREEIEKVVAQVTGDKDVMTEIEYGEPI